MSTPLEHLEEAEVTILSWMQKVENDEDDELTVLPMLAAVLRSVARAAGAVEEMARADP